ncbi:MAG: hypothetical protein NVV73_04170 [Cellvibrionaceae bacterium]|nr:hypothetical protein [Cellvibrionaceae bacterium]
MTLSQQKLTVWSAIISIAKHHLDFYGQSFIYGTDGFSAFHPDNLQRETRLLPMIITNFRIFNQPVHIGADNSPLKGSHLAHPGTDARPPPQYVFL